MSRASPRVHSQYRGSPLTKMAATQGVSPIEVWATGQSTIALPVVRQTPIATTRADDVGAPRTRPAEFSRRSLTPGMLAAITAMQAMATTTLRWCMSSPAALPYNMIETQMSHTARYITTVRPTLGQAGVLVQPVGQGRDRDHDDQIEEQLQPRRPLLLLAFLLG